MKLEEFLLTGLVPVTYVITRHKCGNVCVAVLTRLCQQSFMQDGWVYITSNKPNGTLYVGVTNVLVRRVWEHREGVADGFTKRHNLKRLVYFEQHDDLQVARQREKNIKHWTRAWKVSLNS